MTVLQQLREEEREERKKLIIDIAMKLCMEKNVGDISIRDIAKRADVSVVAIYNYFSSRDDVFLEALMGHIKVMDRLLEKQKEDGFASLEELALGGVDYLMENKTIF